MLSGSVEGITILFYAVKTDEQWKPSQRSSSHFLHKVKDFPACPDTVTVDVLLLASDRREKRKGATQKETNLKSDFIRTSQLGNLCPEVTCLCLFLLYSRKGEKTVYSSANDKITGRNTLDLYKHRLFQIERLWQVTAYLQPVPWALVWSLSHGRRIRVRTSWNSSTCN